MKPTSDFVFSPAQRGLIHTASLLVPLQQREEWSREWLAELWHVRHALVRIDETISLESQREITCFCLGAFPDALCLRTQPGPATAPPAHIHGSAGQTLLWLSAAVAICCIIARLLPGVNAENEAARFPIKSNVLHVTLAAGSSSEPEISTRQFRNWKASPSASSRISPSIPSFANRPGPAPQPPTGTSHTPRKTSSPFSAFRSCSRIHQTTPIPICPPPSSVTTHG